MFSLKTLLLFLIILAISLFAFLKLNHHKTRPTFPQHYPSFSQPLNDRPVIGILSQPCKYLSPEGKKQSYIAASYVKFLESAGAQVVPILYDYDETTLTNIFSKINGIFFPGGDAEIFIDGTFGRELSHFSKTGEFLVNLVLNANSQGNYYPLFGTCLGHELISVIISGDYDLLSQVSSLNHCNTLEFNSKFNISQIYHNMPAEIIEYVKKQKGAYFNHENAVEYQNYLDDDNLKDFFHITSYSRDKKNVTRFIANFEGKNAPVFTFQYHAEKAPFEWKLVDDINHQREMMEFARNLANFFVGEARKNPNSIDDDTLAGWLINNYNTSRKNDSSFEQQYFFDQLGSSNIRRNLFN